MIQISSDFNTAIETLTTETTVNIGDIGEKMNAAEFNLAFNNIELQLIDLYEKIRILEDIQNYCREYVITEIKDKKEKFNKKLKIIEDNADSYIDKSFIACEIPFSDNNEIVRDRDGSVLPIATIENNNIYISGKTMETAIFSSVAKTQNIINYRDNLKNILSNKAYRTIYVVDNPIPDGIEEEITIMFDNLHKCNYIDVKISNCNIVQIKYINDSDGEDNIKDINNIYCLPKIAKGLKIKICSNNYHNKDIKINKNEITTDFWNKVHSNNTAIINNQENIYDTTKQIEENKFKEQNNNYKYNLINWQNKKNYITKRNLAAAYKNGGAN